MSAQLHNAGDPITGLVLRLLESLDTPRALCVWLLFDSEEHNQLVELKCDPGDYVDATSFAKDYQATKLLSKATFLKGLPDPKDAALRKFRESEEACQETNRRLVSITRGNSPVGIHSVLHRAIQLVAYVLGDIPHNSLLEACGWGPGVSSSCKGSRTTGYDKFTSVPEVTPELLPVAHHVLNAWRPWPSIFLEAIDDETGLPLPVSLIPNVLPTTRGNRVAFVPKNSKTHRPIAIEPTVNAFLQKGIGSTIRKKLRAVGVDLSDQSYNRRLARKGSIDGTLCTIDLESASDTIAIELVRLLLPPAWFQLLDLARSKFGTLDGKSYFFWEKFSSMGNGFTFELETLIFWSLTRALAEEVGSSEPLNVYGDDIICDTKIYPRVAEVFSFVGFKVNREKSFATGSFRESCGEDYFRNLNVRPYFLKEAPKTDMDWLVIANTIRLHSTRKYEGTMCCISYRDAWRYAVSRVSKPNRLFGPANANGVIWVPPSEKRFSTWDGRQHIVKCNDIVSKQSAGHKVGGLLLSSWLYARMSATYGRFSHRGMWSVRQRRHSFPEWLSIGDWG